MTQTLPCPRPPSPRPLSRTFVEEVRALFRFSHEHRIPLTFRDKGKVLR